MRSEQNTFVTKTQCIWNVGGTGARAKWGRSFAGTVCTRRSMQWNICSRLETCSPSVTMLQTRILSLWTNLQLKETASTKEIFSGFLLHAASSTLTISPHFRNLLPSHLRLFISNLSSTLLKTSRVTTFYRSPFMQHLTTICNVPLRTWNLIFSQHRSDTRQCI